MPVDVSSVLSSLPNKPSGALRTLLIGDVVGVHGLAVCSRWLPTIKRECFVDMLVINGENSARGGRGINQSSIDSMLAAGADVITTGNHVWRHDEIRTILDNSAIVVRPANFPEGVPGKGYTLFTVQNCVVAVMNLQGRVFFREYLRCPLTVAEQMLAQIHKHTKIVLVDFHAEATSEKYALGLFLDGQVSAVVGTHTHVQTADAHILPRGTAFMSDLGAVTALNSCIGVDHSIVIEQIRTQLPARFKEATNPPFVLSGAFIDINPVTGLAINITPLRVIDFRE